MRNSFQKSSYRKMLLTLPAVPSQLNSFDQNDNPLHGWQITTVVYTLTPIGGGTTVSAQYRAPAGKRKTVTTDPLELAANTTYIGSLALFDETGTVPDNLSAVIFTNSEDYLFYFESMPAHLVTVTRTDKDKNKLEVGLTTRLVTNETATGSLTLTLRRHFGAKDSTFTSGYTEAEVTFPLAIT